MWKSVLLITFLSFFICGSAFGAGLFRSDNIVAGTSGNTPYHGGASVFIVDTSGGTPFAISEDGGTTIQLMFKEGQLRSAAWWHAYGGFESANTTIACTQNVWAKVTNVDGDLWSGVTGEANGISLSNDEMTFANAGDYVGSVALTFHGGNGEDYYLRIYSVTNSSYVGFILGATTLGANNIVNITLPLYFGVAANEVYRMEIMNATDNDDPTIVSGVFYIAYLHD